MRSINVPAALALAFVVGAGLTAPAGAGAFGDDFWNHWGDGQAELATYDLTYPRYGELREGTAVTIFVTETFSDEARVKADPGVHAKSDEFPVMKLNLVQDFATGIYDYNMMTSVFVALASRHGRGAGAASKVSFSSQEWCGQVYHQILPGEESLRHQVHSYFDGEADQNNTLSYPEKGLLEDVLLHWARGLAAPFLTPGEERDVTVLRSTESSRILHRPLDWAPGRLSRGSATKEITVPAGTFEVETLRVEIGGDDARTWTFFVDTEKPRLIVRWESTDGRRADLVAATRMKYWEMHGNHDEDALATLGLTPRERRTP
jgi:hypothetical protein